MLRAEIERLEAVVTILGEKLGNALLAADERQGRIGQHDEAQRHMEARLDKLEASWESLSQANESEALEDFLAGRSRGVLPADLSDVEVGRVRGLVMATKAARKAMLAIAAGLGDVYNNPTAISG